MGRYVLRRLAQAVGVLWAAYTVSFFVLEFLPGDPVSAMAGGGLTSSPVDPAELAALRAQYGFDKPIVVQYLDYLGRGLVGDFGDSVATGRSVTGTIAAALPPTLQLTAAALVLAVLFGGGLAVAATYTSRRWLRQVLLALPPLAISIPSFWAGLMLVQLLSFRIRLFPAFGNAGLAGLVLPAVTLAIPTGALIAQVLAKSLLSTLDAPFVHTARAKGASRIRVHLRHALRSASLPALTIVGLLVGQLVASAVVIETVFSRNGLGRVMASAVSVQDIPLVQGVVVFGAFVFVVVNLIVDLIYPVLDPRIVVAPPRSYA
ncbi:ABC transporter permease [Nocardia sp. NPDC057272]|uniref:ABC transporter permease n=1 Tax=Nocardia sp. NPDC057272 TaxID=3346079 RepID=UPI003624D724